jgi:hypothetical protein
MSLDSHSADRISAAERVDQLCDAFEAQWIKGDRPRIADFIDRLPAGGQPALFYELMLVDHEYRHKAGEQPSRQDYLCEYSRFADQISAAYLQFGRDATARPKKRRHGPPCGLQAGQPHRPLRAPRTPNSDVSVIPLVNGIPDLANRQIVDTGADITSGRDIAVDAAGNIHYVSSGQAIYRVLAPRRHDVGNHFLE